MNLLAPIESRLVRLNHVPAIVPQLEKGQYEGYSYLGAGVIVLALIVPVYAHFCVADKLKASSTSAGWFLCFCAACVSR